MIATGDRFRLIARTILPGCGKLSALPGATARLHGRSPVSISSLARESEGYRAGPGGRSAARRSPCAPTSCQRSLCGGSVARRCVRTDATLTLQQMVVADSRQASPWSLFASAKAPVALTASHVPCHLLHLQQECCWMHMCCSATTYHCRCTCAALSRDGWRRCPCRRWRSRRTPLQSSCTCRPGTTAIHRIAGDHLPGCAAIRRCPHTALPAPAAVQHRQACSATGRTERAYNSCYRYHQYKFIVDGSWRHDESQPYMPDPLGNVNNWLFVRRPEG